MDVNYLEYNNSQYSGNYGSYLDISELSIFSISSFAKSVDDLEKNQNSLKNTKYRSLNLIENFSIEDDYFNTKSRIFSKNVSIFINNMTNSNTEILNETNYIQIIFSKNFFDAFC
jgi:hypothetical protein